ncbi:glycoside hydrolase family 99-like domain-containing protein [Rugamonas sp. CCM 8940]|uniref:glycoside hydrolase family 99-like domain-containing protein n=1 Tax=Rugamonas sp. CCM 8940 TaxID=2765359 RepID=UPI0018F3978D|nr:glycoside hydrolase family 99-like domain-containing protein [Rugamonas sp. CCM 8940]MBJ7308735.1 glycoside hydrolase family 99-like domain-containing protein [Rugamonas sp. CCM 8940]
MVQVKRRQLLTGAGGMLLGSALPAIGQTSAALPVKRTIVAAYFGGWRVPMDKSQQGVHGDNPWGNYPTAKLPGVKHKMQNFPERFPLIGPAPTGYDESQQWVLDAEIKTASTYGIDVFSMNWYRDEFLNHPVENFKTSPNKGLMKFFLQWSNPANFSTSPPRDTREYFFEGIRRAAVHMKDSAYWKQDGKPVFSIFDVTQIDNIIKACLGRPLATPFKNPLEATLVHDAFLQDCHNIVTNVLAGDLTGGISGKLNTTVVRNGNVVPTRVNTMGIAGNFKQSMYLLVCGADVGSWAKCATVQGMYAYNIRQGTFNGVKRLTHSFAEMMTACQQNYDLVLPAMQSYGVGKVWWPTVMTGFDQRPWGGTTADPLHDNSVPTQEQFDAHCKQVRAALDKYPTTTNGVVFVYAWNELGEGGWLTPTKSIGYTRLVSLRDRIKK